jgi:long-chain fatty acid transport protein
MKNGLLTSLLILGAGTSAFPGGIFYNSNQSAEYMRTFERNSAIDNADAVYYNMAGTVKLKEGWTFNLSNQTIFQWATVTTKGNPVLGDNKKYESHNPAWLVPNFYLNYRKGDLALFTSLETIGATAIREWKDGLPTLDLAGKQAVGYGSTASQVIGADAGAAAYASALSSGHTPAQAQALAQAAAVSAGLDASYFQSRSYLKGSSYYLAWRHGAALQVNPWLSLAVAGRLVISQQQIVGRVDSACTYNQNGHDLRTQSRLLIDKTDSAKGYSGEFGLNLYPVPGLVFNATYEMSTPLDFKTAIHDGKNGGGLFVDGSRARLDLPRTLRLGLGYQATPAVRASLGVNTYFEKSVNFEMLNNPANGNDYRRDYRNTVEEAAAVEVQVTAPLKVSLGLNFNQIGQRKGSTIDTSVPGGHANYMSIGTGFQYALSERAKFNFGISHTRFLQTYRNSDVQGDQVLQASFAAQGVAVNPSKEYDKKYIIVAFGLDYHF